MGVLRALDRRNWGYDSRVGGYDTRACFDKCWAVYRSSLDNLRTE